MTQHRKAGSRNSDESRKAKRTFINHGSASKPFSDLMDEQIKRRREWFEKAVKEGRIRIKPFPPRSEGPSNGGDAGNDASDLRGEEEPEK